jgi:hypothetical protein
MVIACFLFIFTGLCVITAGVLLLTLQIIKTGEWPGYRPGNWDARVKKLVLLTAGGVLMALAGFLTGYGI